VFVAEIENEFSTVEPDLKLILESENPRTSAIDKDATNRLLKTIYALPHGVYAMSQDIPELVETSTNLASVKMQENNTICMETSQRSSVLSACEDIVTTVRSVFELAGIEVKSNEGYPGWKPNPESAILKIATESYKKLFGTDAKIKAIHAGLECGLFLAKYPSLDMLSFGPTIRNVHSPDERICIPTVEKFWRHLVDVLGHIPEKR
jgi:dipeptidase D